MSAPPKNQVVVRVGDLQGYAAALLAAGGLPKSRADQVADVLVWANARGADSHGVLRIPRYVEMIEAGGIDPSAEIVAVKRTGAVSVLEAGRAPGATAMIAAMKEAMEKASQDGVGWCSVRNITHAGAIGYYALQAAREGYIGLVMTTSGPLMAYHGARVSGVSTNPIAIAAPSAGEPIVLDMSTSNVALGKIMAARDGGYSIPEDWGMDAGGRPTTDPAKVATLTPMAGPKGSGLSLMIEIMVSVLVGNPIIAPALLNEGAPTLNGVTLALNIASFGEVGRFRLQVDRLAAVLKTLPLAAGTESILMPGERGFLTAAQRQIEGIPISTGTMKRLESLGERLGVASPSAVINVDKNGAAVPARQGGRP